MNIDDTNPYKTAIRLAPTPVHEAIVDKIQAMYNITNFNPLVTEKHLTKTMKDLEDKLNVKFGIFTTTINTNTDWRLEATMSMITHHTTHLQVPLGTIGYEF